jgi:hypothetical protein
MQRGFELDLLKQDEVALSCSASDELLSNFSCTRAQRDCSMLAQFRA